MSKKNVSAIVSGAGWIGGFANLLVQEMRRQGWSDESIHALVTESKPEEQSIQKIVSLLKSPKAIQAGDTFSVTIDYKKSLADMIAVGKYDYVNPNIVEKNFPIQQRPSVSEADMQSSGNPYRTLGVQNDNSANIVLVHLNKAVKTSEVLAYMDKQGLRPAYIEELLAFGEKYPEIQRQFPVVALGSVWVSSGQGRSVACLGSGGSERDLGLYWGGPDGAWGGVYRFAAVSK